MNVQVAGADGIPNDVTALTANTTASNTTPRRANVIHDISGYYQGAA